MADGKNESHDIFTEDPLKLHGLVGHYVQVNLVDGTNILGFVYTVDPVSQSYVLILNERKALSLKIVFQHSVKEVKIISDIPEIDKNIKVTELFKCAKNKGSCEEINTKKERVKLWLLKNLIPIEEKGDVLLIDTLEIHPPYDDENCFSGNSIVLDRIQNLLKDMREKDG